MLQLTDPSRPLWDRLGMFGAGGALMAVISFLRYSVPGWPLHPIGLIVCFSYHTFHSSLSLFITWVVKSVLMRWGGIHSYRWATPFFLGLLLGAVSGSFLSFFCDMIWFPRSGHSVLYW